MVQSEQHVVYRLMEGAGQGSPKMMWKKLTENDCSEWNFITVNS